METYVENSGKNKGTVTVLRDRLVFKKRPKPKNVSSTVQIRISRDDYESISNISRESGDSIQKVVTALIKFAIMHVEYEDAL